jgi:molybdopterin synthase sulfur carrier subunit
VIHIRYFAGMRERLGTGAEEIEAPAPEASVADIAAALCRRGAPWTEVLGAHQRVMVAVNQEMASRDTRVRDGDEVAFFPPVTGG